MVFCLVLAPFADAARQQQFEAVAAALRADLSAPDTFLLGNLWLPAAQITVDALLLRSGSVALLTLLPYAGRLTVPNLDYGTWQLDGQPFPTPAEADNPFAYYQQQRPALLHWLARQLGGATEMLPAPTGFAVFNAPLTFGPEVAKHWQQHPTTHDFQLVNGPAQLPRRLQQLASSPSALPLAELRAWFERLKYLEEEAAEYQEQGATTNPTATAGFWGQKVRQLWRWLGAEDIPADPPYAALPPDFAHREQQDRARLEQLRQELQTELRQQQQTAVTREIAWEKELTELRQQLTRANQTTASQQTNQQEKAALETALHTARTEAATRNQELDARIQQLGQLIARLQAPSVKAAVAATSPGVAATAATSGPVRAAHKPRTRNVRRAERIALALLAVAIVVAATLAASRLLRERLRPAPPAAGLATHQPAAAAATDSLTLPATDSMITESSLEMIPEPQAELPANDPALLRVQTESSVRAMEQEIPDAPAAEPDTTPDQLP